MPAILAVLKPLKGPFRQLPYSEAEQMVAENCAMRPDPRNAPGVFYELVAPEKKVEPKKVVEDDDDIFGDKDPQTYETRTMTAQKPAQQPRRSRTRR